MVQNWHKCTHWTLNYNFTLTERSTIIYKVPHCETGDRIINLDRIKYRLSDL